MPITRTNTTLIAWAEIREDNNIDICVRDEARSIVATSPITPHEALQLANELRDLAAEATIYLTEATA